MFSVSLFFLLRRPTPPGWPNGLPWGESVSPQENSGGEVDIKVTPLVLKAGEKPQFKLEFNTHSVELDFDIVSVAILTDDLGNTYKPATWDGSTPGGHHREGTLAFAGNLKAAKTLTLTLLEIGGVAKREFTWPS